ncbi:MAG TPA: transglycosylase SLT domain-containing protein [Solirubrobacteraceae bacterium]
MAVLLIGALAAIVVGAFVLGAVARGVGTRSSAQQAADLAALAGARAMHAAYPRLFEPAFVRGRPNARHLEKAAYLALGRTAALATADANGAGAARVDFPDGATIAPVRVKVTVGERFEVRSRRARRGLRLTAAAEAELAPLDQLADPGAGGDEYDGPLAHRQGKPMRPDVAAAFDRLARAAEADGVHLVIASAFRTNAEQAALFAQHPDPKWVAPPGQSLHRLATELDLGPSAAHPWLAAHAERFHFIQRYAWEPWHFGYSLNARSTHRGGGGDGQRRGAIPDFVPHQFATPIARAAQRWNVSAALLSAQIYAESGFNPFARSPAGAVGLAQFMPGTARAYGVTDPFDATQAIDAQAHFMHDLLRRFATVPLALAAYNAGPAPVQRCGCIPPYPETRGYVARILGLMGGAGETVDGGGGLKVRLVR